MKLSSLRRRVIMLDVFLTQVNEAIIRTSDTDGTETSISPNGFPSTVEAEDITLHSYAGYLVSVPYISKTGEALWTTRVVSS